MGLRRGYPQPKRLPEKLLAIRRSLGLSQTDLAIRIKLPARYVRISEFERGRRTPSALVLLEYARAAEISLERIIDDELDLNLS